jgi:alpha-N-arabinofuranosidase
MIARISIEVDKIIGTIDQNIYGHFLELTDRCFYGGLWAEMLIHRKFEADDGENEQYGVVKPWCPIGKTPNTYFMHDNTVFYCGSQSQKIVSCEKSSHTIGLGQKNLFVEKGKSYEVRLNLKQENIRSPILVSLKGENKIYASHQILLSDSSWSRYSFTMKSSGTDRNAVFSISFKGKGNLWIGTASLMPKEHICGYRRDVIEALRAINPPNIRWPGGNFVSYYHWKDGIGDRDKRPPKPNYARGGVRGEEWEKHEQWESNDVGIDEFMDLCRLIGANPYVAVNAGDGTPVEAANLVEYCNGSINTNYGSIRAINGHPEPYGITLWGIGNESYGNWQGGHVDERSYAARHRDIARAMRAIDPGVKLVAVGARSWFAPNWNEAVLEIARGYVDYISLHSYAKKYRSFMKKDDLRNPKFSKEFYYYIVSSPYGIEEQIDLTDKEIKSITPDIAELPIAFDEWNCWAYNAPYHEVDFALRDGIYTAGVFHVFRRQSHVLKLANFSMAVNCLPLIRVNRFGLFFNPQYLVFKMFMNHLGPILLKSSVDCDKFQAPEYEAGRAQAIGKIPYLDVSATMSEDNGTLYVSVINLHDIKNIDAEMFIEGWKLKSNGRIISLTGDDYMIENTFEEPNNIKIKEKATKGIKNHLKLLFPKHSVTILELYRK